MVSDGLLNGSDPLLVLSPVLIWSAVLREVLGVGVSFPLPRVNNLSLCEMMKEMYAWGSKIKLHT